MSPASKTPTTTDRLKLSLYVRVLTGMLKGEAIGHWVEGLDPVQALKLQRFVYEKTLEFGIRSRGQTFSQEELLGRLKSASIHKSDITYDLISGQWTKLNGRGNSPAVIKARIGEQLDLLSRVAYQFITE